MRTKSVDLVVFPRSSVHPSTTVAGRFSFTFQFLQYDKMISVEPRRRGFWEPHRRGGTSEVYKSALEKITLDTICSMRRGEALV